ncbi:hypothetical protein HYH03_013346 [Edaphochlamys debaryana]|uniref:Uncharacterized protein n=1 Tax=Edaphochlamys debaryana TaxID=47281 RepID=A0A835XQ66_9CHLO|nr:hypothetical protein HYH03_013346 [Edaphochlamys debaryana]|eukprot:KAG2488041.1 hypothetical protein HYH03_013346 [Edaphochlamys debaryana]
MRAELLARELGLRLTQIIPQSVSPGPSGETEAEAGTPARAGPPRGPRQAPGPLPPDPRLLARLEAVEARAAAAEAKAATLQKRVAEAEAEARQARAEAAKATKAAQLARPVGGGGGGSTGSGWRWLRRRRQDLDLVDEAADDGGWPWRQQVKQWLQQAWTKDQAFRSDTSLFLAVLPLLLLLPVCTMGPAGFYAYMVSNFVSIYFFAVVLPRL